MSEPIKTKHLTTKLSLTVYEVRKLIEAQYPGLNLEGRPVSFRMQASKENQRSEWDNELTVVWVHNVPITEAGE